MNEPSEEGPIPWMPEVFVAPIAEALQGREDASADDAVASYEGIMADEPGALVRSFARRPVPEDPRIGCVEDARRLCAFVTEAAQWLCDERDAVTRTPTRTVEEVVLRLLAGDGARCTIEYNCVRWGITEIPPQAGVAVYERASSGLLRATRIYDDVEPPAVSDTSFA